MNEKRVLLWLWLKIALNDSSAKTYKLYSEFGDITKIYELGPSELAEIDYLNDNDKSAMLNKNISEANETLFLCISEKIAIITIDSEEYPESLLNVYSPPCILFVYGNFKEAFSKPLVTIVGTRSCNTYGFNTAKQISGALAMCGCTIVTGIAEGIDTATYLSASQAGGSVICVFPSGLLVGYCKQKLTYSGITYNGILLSEHLPKKSSSNFAYPERNRLLSGLSELTVVIQAPETSGALITANLALEQGKDVYVVPGNIDTNYSKGSNLLFKDGAYPVTSYQDILFPLVSKYGDVLTDRVTQSALERLETMSFDNEIKSKRSSIKKAAIEALPENERKVFEVFDENPVSVDSIIDETDLSIAVVLASLSSLVTKDLIVKENGNVYSIKI